GARGIPRGGGERRCPRPATRGRGGGRAPIVAPQGPDRDPRAGRPAGPVNLVRRRVDRRPARGAGKQRRGLAHAAAPQGPDPDLTPDKVGPVDLAGRGVDRDADRVVLGGWDGSVAAEQGRGAPCAVQVPDPNLVGVLVRPVDLVVRGIDRYPARVTSARVCEQGRGGPRAVEVADPNLLGAEVGPVDLVVRGINR